ncbi:GLPGLI family protein [Aquimarina sp. MMG016]|uniref:GLPGLI family protein n=1 Tax=Aquimarina sp. MMG016 TaxID=2822690 RepID=UPI001B3A55E6|nr:GLPGLI family protein [Aquimarina sp. MMG016]MBQ4818500.1 GLPGLI family protein [Aquimarina sp. MMG016]
MKTVFTFILILETCLTFGQDFQGKAYYFSKTSLDMNFGGRQMPEDQKRAITERMKSVFEKTFVLTFDESASVYKEEAQLETNDYSGRWNVIMSGLISNNYFKNIKSGEFVDQREFYGKNFLIKDTLTKYTWTMVNETKKIGNYTCFKAITTKSLSEEMDFRSIRRKARKLRRQRENEGEEKTSDLEDENEIPNEIDVVAWYTPEIPINQGPGEFWGLPGLILEIQQGSTTLLCNKIVLNTKEKEEIKKPSKGKEVSQTEFDKIAKKKIEEMANQFSSQRRGGFGGIRGRN